MNIQYIGFDKVKCLAFVNFKASVSMDGKPVKQLRSQLSF